MRIEEIITVSDDHPYQDLPEKEIASVLKFFTNAKELLLPRSLVIRVQEDQGLKWLGIFKNEELVGWAKLRPTTVHNVKYHAVELIYVLPKFRKTQAVGWLLIYGKDLIGTKLIVGDTTDYGGTIFKDGEDLLLRLSQSDKFEISELDLKTGVITPFEVPIKFNKHLTYVIEGLELQFVERLAEAHAAPGALPMKDYQAHIDWLGDV